MTESDQKPDADGRFIRRLLIILGIVAGLAVLVVLRELLILVFGSIVVAVLLTSLTNPIQRLTRLRRGFALALTILLVLGTIAGAGALFGTQVAAQAQQLGEQVPAAWDAARARLAQWGVEIPAMRGAGSPPRGAEAAEDAGSLGELGQDLIGRISSLVMTVFGALANTLLVIAGGVYFAAQPDLYRRGLVKLFPRQSRSLVRDAYDESGKALKLWLLGTFVSMCAVGLFTTVGLWLLGVPSALALGALAAVLDFVPIVGPIAASIPAILIAFSQSTELALWTTALFIVVQQLEGNLIQPLAQRYAVDLPPALLLFSVVAGGFLFGVVGIFFAAPLAVVAFVLVKRLYVREALETETSLPGQDTSD